MLRSHHIHGRQTSSLFLIGLIATVIQENKALVRMLAQRKYPLFTYFG